MSKPTKATLICPPRKWLGFIEHSDGTVELMVSNNCFDARMRVLRLGVRSEDIEVMATPAWETKGRPLLVRAWRLVAGLLAEGKIEVKVDPAKLGKGVERRQKG